MIFTDQLNTIIELACYPKRIISLVPSQSELLWDLGLRHELVGITKFCIHPNQMFQSVARVGGTKTVNVKMIRALKPDLIIGNKEENEQSQIVELQHEFKIWMSDIFNLGDSLKMIDGIGKVVNRAEEAKLITQNIANSFLNLESKQKSVLYLIWKDPYMAAGCATFIGDMLQKIGLVNALANITDRYPNLTPQDIVKLNPELIFLSSEPYPFKENHVKELQVLLPLTKIILVDGELFSWYGSRLQKSVKYFNDFIKLL